MIFLQITDFDSHIQSNYLLDILDNDLTILDEVELYAIDRTRSELEGRFDTDTIFDENQPVEDRNRLIVNALCVLVLYQVFHRINPRNIPESMETRYNEVLTLLERINNQRLNPTGLPLIVQEDDNDEDFVIMESDDPINYKYL